MGINRLDLAEVLFPGKAAVLLVNSPPECQADCWKKIWEEGHSRFATDGAANFLKKFCENGLKLPDLITGDFDSIEDETKNFFLEKKVEVYETKDQNFTDMTKILMEIEKRGFTSKISSIIILGGLGGRFDHSMASINSLLSSTMENPIFILDQQNFLTVLKEGEHEIEFKKAKKFLPGICGLIPIVQKETVVSSKGLHWDLLGDKMGFGEIISTSNQLELEKNNGKLWIETSAPVILTFFADWSLFD
ncbi:hypothetical protein FO519_006802 [Halicephalobus sp. NKZ332]|nr:hypothetical protein FO519_006802 [Halicephalobus sp. NKZ332]